MPLIFQSRIYRRDLQANPSVLYVFGDNEARKGLGGQAGEMRGEPNAIGVATLADPGLPGEPGALWREDDAERQIAVIDADMEPLFTALAAGYVVVFPLDGVGTGIANLAEASPTTFAHLQQKIMELAARSLAPLDHGADDR